MYKKILFVTVSALVLMACSSEPKQNKQMLEVSKKCEATQSIPDGWQQAKITPELKQAAIAAASSMEGKHTVKEVQSATEQVVSGMNYKINFTTEESDTAFVTVVYRNLNGEYQVNSILPQSEVMNCK